MRSVSISSTNEDRVFVEERKRGSVWYGDSGDALLVQRSNSMQDFVMPRYHMHRTFEINFAVSGHAELQSCTHTVQLKGPFVAVHRPYIPHRLRMTDGDEPYFRFIFNLTEDLLTPVISWIPSISPMFEHTLFAFELTGEQRDRLLPRAEEAFRLFKRKQYDIVRPAIAMVLAEMSLVLGKVQVVAAGGEIRYLEEVLQYLITHISEKLICSEVAGQSLFLSISIFSEIRKKIWVLSHWQVL